LHQGRFATFSEREAAGLHDPNKNGPLLGLDEDGVPVWTPNASICIEATNGGGKTSWLVPAIWDALHKGRSVRVGDVKPEFVHILAEAVRRSGFRVVINNPAHVRGFEHTDSNPFYGILEAVRSGGDAVVLAGEMALTLIEEIKSDSNRYFTDNDRTRFVDAALFHAALDDVCYPGLVRNTLSDPKAFMLLVERASRKPELLKGELGRRASRVFEQSASNPQHLESSLTGAAHALSAFSPTSSLGQMGATHAFDPAMLRDMSVPPTLLIDIFPQDSAKVAQKVNALTQTVSLQRLRQHREGRPVLCVLDESTTFPVRPIVDAIELLRSYNIRAILAYQSGASLKRVYGQDEAAATKANCIEIFMSVGDLATAKEISERLGEYSVPGPSVSGVGSGGPLSGSVNDAKRAVMTPDEILALPKSKMIVLAHGLRPMLLDKVPYFEMSPLKDLVGENPHERHPKSKTTRLVVGYPEVATDRASISIPDLHERLHRAAKREGAALRQARTSFPFSVRSFLWAPIAVGVAIALSTCGTPHMLLTYDQREAALGCTYLGAGGTQLRAYSEDCPLFALLKHQE
jgi:type IV secretion system protein VirD4